MTPGAPAPYNRGMRRPAVAVALGVVVAAAVTLGIAAATGAFGGGSHPRIVRGAPPPPSPRELTAIKRFVLQQAAAAGDPHPTSGVLVPTTRRIAEQVDAGDPSEANTPAYFVVVHGTFEADAPGPPGAAAPKGTILTLTIDPRTNQSTDGGVEDRMPDVDAIGRPEPLSFPDLPAGPPSLGAALRLTKHVPCGGHRVSRRTLRRFRAVTAVSCIGQTRTYPGQGQWEVLVRKVAAGSVSGVQRYYEKPDQSGELPQGTICSGVLVEFPVATFVDAQGRWETPARYPRDRCGQPLGYPPSIDWRVVRVQRVRQLVSAPALAAHCAMRVGNTAAWAGPPRNSTGGPLFDVPPWRARICIYRTPPGNFAVGRFVRGFRLDVSSTERLVRALEGPGPRRGCPKQRTFAEVGASVGNAAVVELGGCYRVERPDRLAGTAQRAVVRAILGGR